MAHKLLLADDSVTIQRVIELTFADEDVEVTAVGNGQLAIDRLEADPPDIILADVDMPNRDGYEVAAYVKSRPKLAHIPVVLLTGAFEPIDQARALAAGSSDVLAKPFEPQMVINRVKELLGRKRTEEAAHASPLGGLSHDTKPQMGDPQPPGRQPAGEDTQSVSLDDYFDQLDAAFSNLQPDAAPSDSDEVEWPIDLDAATAGMNASPAAGDTPAPPPPVADVPALVAPAFAPGASAGKPAAPSFASGASAGKPAAPSFASGASAGKPAAPSFASGAAAGKPAAPSFAPGASAGTPGAPVAFNAPVAPVAPVAPIAPSSPVAPHAPIAAAPAPGATVAPIAPIAPVVPVVPKPAVNPFANLSAARAEAAARPAAPVISDEVIEAIVSRVLQRMSDHVVRETVTDIVSQTAERLVQEEIERIRTGS